MEQLFILLQTPDAPPQKNHTMLIMMGLIFVVFYFFLIRPQQRRQKEIRTYRSGLQKGDKIVTTGGIYGKINNLSENVITIDVGNNVLMKVDRNAILKDSTDLGAQK